MKKGSRKAVLVSLNDISAICVFRGIFLEKIFFGSNDSEVKEKFYQSSITGEVKEINKDEQLEEYCKNILDKIKRKLNKLSLV